MEFVNVCGVPFFIIELEKLEIVDVESIFLLVSHTSYEKSCSVLIVVLLILFLRLRLSSFNKSIK
jgi:hypothetical protein